MDPEAVVYREEVTGMLFAIADINDNVRKILSILQEEDDGEVPQDDA